MASSVDDSGRCFVVLEQMMGQTGRCVSVSEPNAPYVLAAKYRKFGDSPELRRLARDAVRWECRPHPAIQPTPLGYFVQFFSHGIFALPLFRQRSRSPVIGADF